MTKNIKLLNKLMEDGSKFSHLYQPGIYWKKKNIQTYKEILKKGINKFRGSDNRIGESFSDNQNINILNDYYGGLRGVFKFLFEKIYPFSKVLNRQLHLTNFFRTQSNLYKSNYLKNNHEVLELLKIYKFKDTALFGCDDFIEIDGNNISSYYLNISNIHKNFSKKIKFDNCLSFFEIGGGFGANVHFLIQNYPNIKKFIYLDLPVNLFVANQYLKFFYEDNVIDYLSLKDKKIRFSNNNELEIFCIPPWKIADIDSNYDIFQNSSSFVEMPKEIVQNYSNFVETLKNDRSKIILSSYINKNYKNTLDPHSLDNFFNVKFESFLCNSLIPNKKDIFFISK